MNEGNQSARQPQCLFVKLASLIAGLPGPSDKCQLL